MFLPLLSSLLLGLPAAAAEFQPPVRLLAGGVLIRVESPGYAAPCWADINGDGQKDLLVGQFKGGKIQFCRNLGAGKLAKPKWLKAEGTVAEIPGVWCCTSSTPQFVDLDGDGHRDILSGSYSRMQQDMAGLLQVLHGKADGTFRRAEVLRGTDGEPLIIPINDGQRTDNICTRPFAVEWDGDGHLDLVVGNFAGTFFLFKGQGQGKFRPVPEAIKADGQPLKLDGYHSDPFVVDWDGDGDLDLMSGSSEGGVQWAENCAGPGKPPELKPFRWLIEHGPRLEYGQILREADLKGPASCARIWVDDVNSDGKLDILVGDMAPLLAPAGKVAEADFQKKLEDWNNSLLVAVKDLNRPVKDPKKRNEAQERYQKLYNQRTEFMTEDRTGFVWLYLRK